MLRALSGPTEKYHMANEKSWSIYYFLIYLKLFKISMRIFYPILSKETVYFAQGSELPQAINDFLQIILWKTKILHWTMLRLKTVFLNQITASRLSSQTISSWLNCWSLVVQVVHLSIADVAHPLPGASLFPCAQLIWYVKGHGRIMCHRSHGRTIVEETAICWRRFKLQMNLK